MSIFNDVLIKKPGRSLFNLKHEKKFSADFGWLYPILVTECVPGDTFKVSTEFFVRTAPLVAPIMHRVNVKLNYFFVPNRLIWDEWPDFITGVNQKGSYEATSGGAGYFVTKVPPFAHFASNDAVKSYLSDGKLADFLGFPTCRPNASIDVASHPIDVQLLPFRAYQKIYNDWFRNQNVEAEQWTSKVSGNDSTGLSIASTFSLRRRMWEKDYFTSALPFAQRGDAVNLPIAEVKYKAGSEASKVYSTAQATVPYNANIKTAASGGSSADPKQLVDSVNNNPVRIDNSDSLQVVGGTVNDLRAATRLQVWLEKNARVGGRYVEQVLGHFGVHSSDARLDRAEYLGGFSCPIVVSDVEQNSASASNPTVSGTNTPQGNLAGKGTAYGSSKPIKCFCEEHGFLFGILSIVPRSNYQDGLPRMFQRNYKEDYYFPEFANLGEQEVNKSELFFDYTNYANRSKDRFGFQERYCEYKYIPSTVHGEFKNSLQFWHLGRSFTSQPALNKSFVEIDPAALSRVFAVTSNAAHFYIDLVNDVKALRPMPKQAIPSL